MSAYTLRRDDDEAPTLDHAGRCVDCGVPLRDGLAGEPHMPRAAYSPADLAFRCTDCFTARTGAIPVFPPASPTATTQARHDAQAKALRRAAGWCLSCGWPTFLPAHNAHSTLCSCPKGTP